VTTATTVADIGGPRGYEIGLRFAKDVGSHLASNGVCVTYFADFVEYQVVADALTAAGLRVQVRFRDIYYPFDPPYGYPVSHEISHREQLEEFFDYQFKDVIVQGQRYLGFRMVHLVASV
jgi:hypothetical protein